MFGIGSTELLVILVIALIVLGPKSLAHVTKSLGKAMGEFKRASTEFNRALNVEAAQEEFREKEAAQKTQATSSASQTGSGEKAGHSPNNTQKNEEAFAEGMSRIGAWEKQGSDFTDLPPDSPLAQALAKARAAAEGIGTNNAAGNESRNKNA